MAEIQAIKSTISQGPCRRNNPPNLNSNNGRKELPAWRFQNPNNKKFLQRGGWRFKWFSNDCHDKPMWCG
eukprot:3980422-Ditylum_brightwellii.AAC.1